MNENQIINEVIFSIRYCSSNVNMKQIWKELEESTNMYSIGEKMQKMEEEAQNSIDFSILNILNNHIRNERRYKI